MVQSKATPVYEGLTRGQVADSERLAAKVRDPYQNAMANVPKSEPYRPLPLLKHQVVAAS